jgi:hypothetical protein
MKVAGGSKHREGRWEQVDKVKEGVQLGGTHKPGADNGVFLQTKTEISIQTNIWISQNEPRQIQVDNGEPRPQIVNEHEANRGQSEL